MRIGTRAILRYSTLVRSSADRSRGRISTTACRWDSTVSGERAKEPGVQLDPQNPHLPAAAPACLLSREVTGEVRGGTTLTGRRLRGRFCGLSDRLAGPSRVCRAGTTTMPA